MACVNVNRNVCDTFYRYKMPRIMAKVEGKGNGVKTVIANMCEVAKALARPPTYPTKYFGCELGAQVLCDAKNERFVINGSHDSNKLQTLLDGFIKRYVLCPSCDNPETVLSPQPKKNIIGQMCKACGYRGTIDMKHRLSAYILKNPPDAKPNPSVASKAGKVKGKGKSRRQQEPGSSDSKQNSSHDGEEDSFDSGANFTFTNTGNEDDDDWGEDVSDTAVKERMQDLTDGARNLAVDAAEAPEKQRVDFFYDFVKQKNEQKLISQPGVDKDLLAEAQRLSVREKATLILAEVLFSKNLVSDLKNHRMLLLRFCHQCPKAQRYLITGIEQTIVLHRETLLPRVPHVFKALYDLDIVEEDAFFEWEKKLAHKKHNDGVVEEILTKAAPFINWLREASEEDSSEASEDGEEEDLEIAYDDRAIAVKIETTPIKKITAVARDEEDEIDIDAI